MKGKNAQELQGHETLAAIMPNDMDMLGIHFIVISIFKYIYKYNIQC